MGQGMSNEARQGGKGTGKLLLLLPLLLVAAGAGLWFTGILPKLLHGSEPMHAGRAAPARPPVFFDMPCPIASLRAVWRPSR